MKSETRKRRRFDIEFKREAVRIASYPDRSVESVARDLGIHPNMLHRWKREFEKDLENAFPGKGHQLPEQERIKQLEKELRDVKEERDILKKAMAIFSKHPK